MIMKKLAHYFLMVVAVILATALIISLFYSASIYKKLSSTNREELPAFLVRIINRLSPPPPASPLFKAEVTIQIPEGWNNQEIARYLETKGPWTSQAFLQAVGSAQLTGGRLKAAATSTNFAAQFSFLQDRPPAADLEGYLFPDTYRIYASSSVDEIITRMLSNFDEKLTPQMRADIKSQDQTIYNIITMASIVEKEAPIDYRRQDNQDAKIIAGIFWNRLKNGQALESDATLSYILNDNESQHSGESLTVDSPYNTYKYRGLPPGPISNPGLLAIAAAIYPTASPYNYFLTTPGKNQVIYARTYAEHLQNKAKYLR